METNFIVTFFIAYDYSANLLYLLCYFVIVKYYKPNDILVEQNPNSLFISSKSSTHHFLIIGSFLLSLSFCNAILNQILH